MMKNSIQDIKLNKESNKKSNQIRHFGYIRSLGLLLVLIYHFYPKILPGGFIGVDIFFTFSGYLITALIIAEVGKSHRFDLKRFAERRFFRIFPTVFFGILVTLPLSLLGSSDLRFQIKQQVLATLSFISNLYESSTGTSYENNFAPHMYVHLWSLAIEVQFYIAWALVLWFVIKFFGKYLRSKLFLLSSVIALTSMISMFGVAIGASRYSLIYYSPFLHIFPFFFGAALASLVGIDSNKFLRRVTKKYRLSEIRNLAVVSAVSLIILALFLHFDWKFTYLFGFSLASIFSLVLIFSLRVIHEMTVLEEPRVIKGISDISYGVYIFHWAFLVIFLNLRLPHSLSVFLTVILSFSLAAVMFYLIDPIVRGRKQIPRFWESLIVLGTIVLMLPSGLAIIKSSDATSLSDSLWQGTVAQTSQNLYMAENLVATGQAGANILVIGDSVANGTRVAFENAPILEQTIPATYGDTAGDRKISSDLMSDLTNDLKNLPSNTSIVIALGTNSTEPDTDIQILKNVIKQYSVAHHIVLVTPANFSAGGPFNSDKIADWEVSIKGKYKNVSIADWRATASGHPEYYDADGVHISDRPAGRTVWLNLVKAALAGK
ncbi:MAG: acyltransferase [Streptococcaceae bacterium]|jgi:peptidoglycan/LPS O-acetylase OafA/YrhL|nr:acyltransferase [Streptococcaceae bacterium]